MFQKHLHTRGMVDFATVARLIVILWAAEVLELQNSEIRVGIYIFCYFEVSVCMYLHKMLCCIKRQRFCKNGINSLLEMSSL